MIGYSSEGVNQENFSRNHFNRKFMSVIVIGNLGTLTHCQSKSC